MPRSWRGNGALVRGLAACAVAVCVAGGRPWASGPILTPGEAVDLLSSMHPDYALYISDVRYGASRFRPASLYAGLVRRGGLDPLDPDDGPRAGRGVTNDLIIYADTFEPWRTPAWRLLLADHEYFHARHLAKGFDVPTVGFGRPRIDADYYEALAWGYVLRRAGDGVYGRLSRTERAEAGARYRDHYDGFRRFVMETQPSAWAHYGRFLPQPDTCVTPAASAPTGETSPRVDAATR